MANVYTALFLDDASRTAVLEFLSTQLEIPEDYLVNEKFHMTIDTKPIAMTAAAALNGQTGHATIKSIGVGEGIMAVEVDTDIPSKNERKHITVARRKDVKPFKSNEIADWRPVSTPIILSGLIEEVTK
jgi:hypothetical protein